VWDQSCMELKSDAQLLSFRLTRHPFRMGDSPQHSEPSHSASSQTRSIQQLRVALELIKGTFFTHRCGLPMNFP
jgi:hypothetical protein